MSVRKIDNSWWVDFRVEGIRYRKRSPESSRASAAAYETVLRERLARGKPLCDPGPGPTLEEFVQRWFQTYVIPNNKLSEQRGKHQNLTGHILPWFGQMRLDAIQVHDIDRYKASRLARGLSPKTVNNHLATLGKCLRTAQEWGEVVAVPRIRLLKVPPQSFDFLSPDECRTLLGAAESDPTGYAMILVALRTGMRLGELRGLEWRNVDLDRRTIFVCQAIVRNECTSPKNNRTRFIPMTAGLVEVLTRLRRQSKHVFADPDNGPISGDIAYTIIRRACHGAGLRRIGWHVLRHTFASHLAAAGVPIRVVQDLLGHSTITMTMRYAHLAPSALLDAVAVLEAKAGCESPWAARGQATIVAGSPEDGIADRAAANVT
jgi:integrase